ncbi:MAG TPA: ABC transporter ATP-binding protein [Nitrospiria bacterium]|nr:ABC transporter ATP-binding protein [Nitrospiria bacterium]
MLEVRDLTISFRSDDGDIPAVRSVSFNVQKGETLAIVGESGSGKSVTAMALTRLLPEPAALYETGEILLEGKSILHMDEKRLRGVRGNQIAYVFQEPATSLNPVFSVYEQIAETIRLHRPDVREVRREVIHWLDQVGIVDSARRLKDYPFQLSGGMQQRVMIAMALCCQPAILVADEPTTALDVTIQRQILDLFQALKMKFRMSMILITHNFGIIRGLADKVAVMFRGRVVEFGSTESILRQPQHPYTRALIECIPRLGLKLDRLKTIDYSTLNG